MTQPQIIQPGQVNLQFEHILPPGFQPAIPVNMRVGETMATVGGLTVREEIASRILASMAERLVSRESLGDEMCRRAMIAASLDLTDALLVKTRPQETPPQEA